MAAALARRYGPQVRIAEPYAKGLPAAFDTTGALLIDLDTGLATCPTMIVLVDHDLFRSVSVEDRAGKMVLDTRAMAGQPAKKVTPALHRAS